MKLSILNVIFSFLCTIYDIFKTKYINISVVFKFLTNSKYTFFIENVS